MFETAFVTDKLFEFAVFVFSSGNAENFFPFHPHDGFPAAFRTTAVCIERPGEPNAAFEAECFVSQRSHRAYADALAAKNAITLLEAPMVGNRNLRSKSAVSIINGEALLHLRADARAALA